MCRLVTTGSGLKTARDEVQIRRDRRVSEPSV